MAHGLGTALGEHVPYDGDGQLQSGTLMDYLLLRAADVPQPVVDHVICPTPENPLGVRAVGESGAISPPAVIAGAVEDALQGRARVTRVPLPPARVFELLERRRTGTGCRTVNRAISKEELR